MANPNLSEVVTTTLRNRSKKLADNVTNHNALLRRLKDRGNVKTADGGRTIVQELEYAENTTFKWYSGYEVLDKIVGLVEGKLGELLGTLSEAISSQAAYVSLRA